jgi:hypothetical protein
MIIKRTVKKLWIGNIFFSIVLFFLIFLSFSFTAQGSSSTLTIEEKYCSESGGDIKFRVLVENTPNPVRKISFKVIYNKDILEYISYSYGNLVHFSVSVDEGYDSSDPIEYHNQCQKDQYAFSGNPNNSFSLNVDKSSIASLIIHNSGTIPNNGIKQGDSGELIELTFRLKQCKDTALVLTDLADDLQGWDTVDGYLKTPKKSGSSGSGLSYLSYPGYITPTLGYTPFTLPYSNPYLPNSTYNNYGAFQGFYPAWQPTPYWPSLFQQPSLWQPNLYQQPTYSQSLWPFWSNNQSYYSGIGGFSW